MSNDEDVKERTERGMTVSVELLLTEREFCNREYERIGAEFIENEAMGEGRVSLYLGVWSAALGGAGAILSLSDPVPRPLATVALVGLVVVLALGVVTAVRILKRNYQTDQLVDSLMRLRYLLRPAEGTLSAAALPWNDREDLTKRCRRAVRDVGLLHVVCLANAVVPALWLVICFQVAAAPAYVATAVMAAVILQLLAVDRANQTAWEERREKGVEFRKQLAARVSLQAARAVRHEPLDVAET